MDRSLKLLKKKLPVSPDRYEILDAVEDLQREKTWRLRGQSGAFWRDELLSGQESRVRSAVKALKTLGPLCVIVESELASALGQPLSWSTRCQILGLLAKLGPSLEGSRGAIIEALGDPHWKVRGKAAKALRQSRRTDEAVEALRGLCSDEDPYARKHALKSLHRLAPEDSEALLFQRLHDPEIEVLKVLVKELRTSSRPLSEGEVTRLLEILDMGLGNYDHEDLVQPSVEILRREAASFTLKQGHKLLKGDDAKVSLALSILEVHGSKDDLPKIAKALAGVYRGSIVRQGLRLMHQLCDDFSDFVSEIDFTEWCESVEAIEVVGSLLDDNSGLIRDMLQSDREDVQGLGLHLWKTCAADHEDELETVLELLKDDHCDLDSEIFEILGELLSDNDRAMNALLERLETEESEWEFAQCAQALSHSGRRAFRGHSILKESIAKGLANDWDEDELQMCIEAFLRIGGTQESVDRMRQAQKEEEAARRPAKKPAAARSTVAKRNIVAPW